MTTPITQTGVFDDVLLCKKTSGAISTSGNGTVLVNQTNGVFDIQNNNGITGDDEMSEAVRMTWDSSAMATNYTAPTPGAVPVALQ